MLTKHPKLIGREIEYALVSLWNNDTTPFFCEILIDGTAFADTGYLPWKTPEEAKHAAAITALFKLDRTASIDDWKVLMLVLSSLTGIFPVYELLP